LVERVELLAPDAAFLELAEPGLDGGLALGVAVFDPGPLTVARAGDEQTLASRGESLAFEAW
jgi:hypothetical protein